LLIVLGGGTLLVGALVSLLSVRTIIELNRRYEAALGLVRQQTDELRASYAELDRRVEERTRDLNAANKELEIFSYSAAHDLRAPLRWIVGTNRLFVEDYGHLVPKEGLQDLDKVNQAALRLSKLIDSLLEMARLGKAPIQRRTVNLSEVAAQAVEELRGRDWPGHVEASIEPDLKVEGDPVLLSVLMQNLLENAFKFSGAREGNVVVSGTRSPISVSPASASSEASSNSSGGVAVSEPPVSVSDSSELVISVSDNGVGFDNNYAGNLFKPFERLHGDEEFAGTGMGLANAKRIVERHGGRIWADGKPGEGATFYFTLPDAEALGS
jgi:light-regulated signal transduction histidine kinase (bacteriophytochrome)